MPGNLTDTAELIALDAINGVANALFTAPLKLRIVAVLGSDSTAGTAYSGATDQTITFVSGGASSNAQTYASLGTGEIKGWEIWDANGSPRRIWWSLWSPVAATAQTSGDTITKAAHGLVNGDKVVFQPGYAPTGTTGGTTYFVVGSTTNTFQVATTLGGSAVDITADSASVTYGLVKTIANAGDSFVCNTGDITTFGD